MWIVADAKKQQDMVKAVVPALVTKGLGQRPRRVFTEKACTMFQRHAEGKKVREKAR